MEVAFAWPEKSGEYKVVQAYMNGRPCLWFSGEGARFHSDIILKAAERLGKECPVDSEKEMPALESDWYNVVGAGNAEIDAGGKKARFFGMSKGYGIGIDQEHLEKIKALCSEWEIKS